MTVGCLVIPSEPEDDVGVQQGWRGRVRIADAIHRMRLAQSAIASGGDARAASLEAHAARDALDQLILDTDAKRYRPSYEDAIAALELASEGSQHGWQSYELAPLIQIGLSRLKAMGR